LQLKPYEKPIPEVYKNITGFELRQLDLGLVNSQADFEIVDSNDKVIGLVEATSLVDKAIKRLERELVKRAGETSPLRFKVDSGIYSLFVPLSKRTNFKSFEKELQSIIHKNGLGIAVCGTFRVYNPEHWDLSQHEIPFELNECLYRHGIPSLGVFLDETDPGMSFYIIQEFTTVLTWEEVSKLVENALHLEDNVKKLKSRPGLSRYELFLVSDRLDMDMAITRESPGASSITLPQGITGVWLAINKTMSSNQLPVWFSDGGSWQRVS